MFERRAPAIFAGRLLHLVQDLWNARRTGVPPTPRLDDLSDHLRRDVGLGPGDGPGRGRRRHALEWPWQRF